MSAEDATRLEMLQNELDVLRAESTDDRLKAAARLLELEQECVQLRDENSSLKQTRAADRSSLAEEMHDQQKSHMQDLSTLEALLKQRDLPAAFAYVAEAIERLESEMD